MHEFDLLQHVFNANDALPAEVSIPPGDDMGAIRLGDRTVLVTVDQLAAGVHVDLATATLAQVGRKAITRNLSDVAAMAAKPVAAVAAACLPRDFGEDRAVELFQAMRQTAQAYACPLIGGDVSMWDQPMLLTVTVLAEPMQTPPILRRGASPGDTIYVTGRLGGSGETVMGKNGATYTHHLDFQPRIVLAQRLASQPDTRPSCMIDLSDGLARDVTHLCKASQTRAIIEADKLPLALGAQQAAQRTGQPAWRHALGDGEDYELLFCHASNALPAEIEGVPITVVGQMAALQGDQPLLEVRLPGGAIISEQQLRDLGWEHRSEE